MPKKKEMGIFGEKIFTMEEEHSLLLFTAGICFGIGLVALTVKEYTFAAVSLFSLLFVLLFIDKRISEAEEKEIRRALSGRKKRAKRR